MKILAFYLPQFHEIPENDVWWHKGFTEWDNLKSSHSFKKDNYQPRVPLNDNYYDLSNPEVLLWQSKLAKKYSVYGFCFYHYWYEGKLLLQKPAENLLYNPNIDLHFCFSWANHSWTSSPIKKEAKIFIKQTYGNQLDWISHFNYLLPFFLDSRYIKIQNKPLFVIHDSSSFISLDKMMGCWNELAKAKGFSGIFFVNTLKGQKDQQYTKKFNFDAQVEFQPTCGLNSGCRIQSFYYNTKRILFRNFLKKPTKFSYEKVWDKILKTKYQKREWKTYLGAYTDWDNTARWKRIGNYHYGASPTLFKKYLTQQISRAKVLDSDFIFINAWNEWGEGAYLEPDEKFKYEYLEAVREALKNEQSS